MSAKHARFDPFLSVQHAEQMLRIAESFGSFGTYAEEATSEGLGENLPQRFDVGLNYVSHGLDGLGNADASEVSLRRTNYFRETYAYGNELQVKAIAPFMESPELTAAAQSLGGSPYVVPGIVYANILVPGQELAIHTDVPEFRGLNRKNTPQWLLVCMHHSGLFNDYRVPILTAVSWFGNANGGAFTFYPEGGDDPREAVPAVHNTAILLDTDDVFHGVERVAPAREELPMIDEGTHLCYEQGEYWSLRQNGDVVAEYTWDDLRYSISWKGYCFADQASHQKWRNGNETLTIPQVLARFAEDFADRGLGRLNDHEPNARAQTLVKTYIRFPQAPTADCSQGLTQH